MTDIALTIKRIGARGDGVARHEGRVIFVPFTAPGDVVHVRLERDGDSKLIELVSSGARQPPPCPHFGACGGCSLQHVADAAYAEAKRGFVREALAHRRLDPDLVEPIRRIRPGTRRRARLAMNGNAIGFHRRASHAIADLKRCPVLHPRLVDVVQALRPLGLHGAASLTLADTGVDLLLELRRAPDLATLEALAAFAGREDLARLSYRVGGALAVPVVQRRPVQINFADAIVDLPTDCFLQATTESEAKIRALVLDGIGAADPIADLYCGVGTFSFALAKYAKVHAVDEDALAVAALQSAARRARANVTTEPRDLTNRPMTADELNRFDAVVFDPPHAGAATLSQELARSKVGRIVAVSCNPATFARDARTLVDGGYRLVRVAPVDQFLWSAQVELVAHFVRQ